MPSDPFVRLVELAEVLPSDGWMLVGGLMVHCHAQRAGLLHVRPTDDADLVVEVQTAHYTEGAHALEGLGYVRHLPLDHRAPFHRFSRPGGEHVDLMVADDTTVRFAGRPVLGVPGARSALRRTVRHPLTSTTDVRLPDLGSALSLKGAAYRQPGPARTRHLQDGVTLFACAGTGNVGPDELRLSKSMRVNVNVLIAGLDEVEAWSLLRPQERRRAVQAVHTLRPDWEPQPFVLGARVRPRPRGR